MSGAALVGRGVPPTMAPFGDLGRVSMEPTAV